MILVENVKPYIFGVAGQKIAGTDQPINITLAPGINKLDPMIWNIISVNPIVQRMLLSGDLRVTAGTAELPFIPTAQTILTPATVAPVLPEVGENLNAIPVRQAVTIIRSTFDKALLTSWLSGETRTKLISVLQSQLRKVTVTDEDLTDDELTAGEE